MTAYQKMESYLVEDMAKRGNVFHYKARAECFPDVINAFSLMHKHAFKTIKVCITSDMCGDADFDFWTQSSIEELRHLWDTEGVDLHRISQTIKPFDNYDGKIEKY